MASVHSSSRLLAANQIPNSVCTHLLGSLEKSYFSEQGKRTNKQEGLVYSFWFGATENELKVLEKQFCLHCMC